MESRVDAVNPGETEGSSEQDAAVGLTSGKKAEEKPHFVIQHRPVLIQKVSAVMPIVDRLYSQKMVNSEHYATIKAEKTTMAQMRELYIGKIDVAGPRIRAAFYSALEQHEPHLLVSLGAVLPSEDSANSEVLTPQRLKSYLKKEGQHLIEWKRPEENPEETPLNQDFTEVNVTVVGRGEVNKEHEVSQIETMSRKTSRPETPIKSLDISKPLPGEGKIRTVLMKGVAGSGKTALTQKYIQDWAEDKANQDILFLFPFAFRELNVKQKEKKCSLMELLRDSFGEINKTDICSGKGSDVMFIFDGLDEFSTPLLDLFQKKEICTDVEKIISVEMLLTNLIKGNLLPNARIWITTRPAAATQIPAKYVDRVTEVRGFTDDQKEEYFKKRISDETMANKIISHIKTSRILHIMCHIPVFCWIIAYVLKDILITGTGMLPKTMTEMFIHFMLVQSKQKEIKYDWSPEKNTNAILSMGKLAYKHLEKGNLIFSEADLKECGIDINDAAVCSGVFAQTFKEVRGGLHKDKVFSFVHLSVQEFLAALYVFHTFTNTGVNVLSPSKWSKLFRPQLNDLYKSAVDMALKSPNGHLDLFLRFLLGLSSKTNQTLLQRLLEHTGNSSQANQKTVQYIKKKIRKNLSPERTINLFHCLNELGDHSLEEEIQQYLTSGSLSTVSPAQWSALAFVLLSSGKELDVFDLKKYGGSEEALLRLLPVVKASNRALLSGCNLTVRCCVELASTLSSNCSLKELDISNNDLQDLGIKHLCSGLRSPDCKLETLRLSGCNLSEQCCVELASTLSSNCSLKELDISNDDLQDLGIKHLCSGLRSPDCKLETLRLSGCNLTERCCVELASTLSSNCSLKELDISNNDLQDLGIKHLCSGLRSPDCKLETLRLSGCNLTERCCVELASTLSSNCSLKELDISNNDLQDLGIKHLCSGLRSPDCKLETLRLSGCNLTEQCCVELASTLSSNCSLKELDISNNDLQDLGIKHLCSGLRSPDCKLETLRLSYCMVSKEGCSYLVSALRSNSHLKVLDLSYNHPGDQETLPSAGQLQTLSDHSGECRLRPGVRKYVCELTLDQNTAHRYLSLSENYRKVTLVKEDQRYPDHPDRFTYWRQVLCKETLTGRCYSEMECSGHVRIGVTNREIKRKGSGVDCLLGNNNISWCLRCDDDDNSYYVVHNGKMTKLSVRHSDSVLGLRRSNRVAVYVDCPAGTLSFYKVSSNTLTHLHTFQISSTGPLCVGFMCFGSVSLCQI